MRRMLCVLLGGLALAFGQSLPVVAVPRIGNHSGYTRAVLDLPPDAEVQLSVLDHSIKLNITGVSSTAMQATAFPVALYLKSWQYTPTVSGIEVELQTPHTLTDTRGYTMNILPPETSNPNQRVVLDFAPAMLQLAPILNDAVTLFPPDSKIVLDAGHGGKDSGAQGMVSEKVVTLNVAQMVRDILQRAGAEVRMTRDSDMSLHPDKSTDLLSRAAMAAPPYQYFVSIHVNADAKGTGYGLETWFFPNVPESKTFAQNMLSSVLTWTGHHSRGVQQAPFVVIKRSSIPATLLEIGFTSNPIDGQNLKNPLYLQRLALGIAWGIRNMYPSTSAPVFTPLIFDIPPPPETDTLPEESYEWCNHQHCPNGF